MDRLAETVIMREGGKEGETETEINRERERETVRDREQNMMLSQMFAHSNIT